MFDNIDATVVGHATSEDELIELAESADALIVQYVEVSERSIDELRRKAAENVLAVLSEEDPHGQVNDLQPME